MQRHLHDIDGNILWSGEVADGLPDNRVACALLSEYRKTMPQGQGPQLEGLHVRDAVFEGFVFDRLKLRACVFENVDFERCLGWTGWTIQAGRLERCRFTGKLGTVSWTNCDLKDVDLSAADISGSITKCRLHAVQMRLNAAGEIPVSLFQSTLQAVVFADADVPEVPDLYSRVYAEILKGRDMEPAHPWPWLYNILEAVLGRVWTDMAERHGFVTARDLLFYYNSDDTALFTFGRTGQQTVDFIRERAG